MKLTDRFIDIRNNPEKYCFGEGWEIYEDHGFRVQLLNAGGVWRSEMFDDLASAKEYATRKGGDAIIEKFAGIYEKYIEQVRLVYDRGHLATPSEVPVYGTRTLEFVSEDLEYIPATNWLEAQRQVY